MTGMSKRGKLEPILEVTPTAGKMLNPRDKMRKDLKKGSKTVKIDKSKSSKCLLWFDRAKRILSDVDESIGNPSFLKYRHY